MANEIMEKLKTAKSAEELLEIAKANGKELTAEQAKTLFERLHSGGELSDDDLDKVAGGAVDEEWWLKFPPTFDTAAPT